MMGGQLLLVVMIAAVTTSLEWHQGDFNGQLKWAFNCDFDGEDDGGGGGSSDDEADNTVDQTDEEIRIIGVKRSERHDCGWLCWADVECCYFSHSQGTCRLMTLDTKSQQHQLPRHLPVPYLAESDTICGYIPSRITSSLSSQHSLD